mmetsp:Transcript_32674/g.79109  ORF Transcript_32674/g.79109 Transcript_32674/m.79109 type:complete len:277 (-) Transcript_32674:1296-2126(-)
MLVAVNGRRDGLDDTFPDVGIGRQRQYRLAIGLTQVRRTRRVLLLAHMVRGHVGLEHRKARTRREPIIVRRAKDSCDVHLLPWPGAVHEIVQEEHLLRTGDAARGHGSGTLLQIHALEITVARTRRVELEGTLGVARRAAGGGVRIDVSLVAVRTGRVRRRILDAERPGRVFASNAIVIGHFQLRSDSGSARDHAGHLDQAVEMTAPQIPERVHYRHVTDAHVYLVADGMIAREQSLRVPRRRLVQHVEHFAGRLAHPERQRGLHLHQVQVRYLQR